MLSFSLLWLIYVTVAIAVKHNLFKDCQQSGFCSRNRHFARQIASSREQSPYFIDHTSVSQSKWSLEAVIHKSLPNNAKTSFVLLILLLLGDSVRFKVNERRPHIGFEYLNTKRFDGAAAAAMDEPPEQKTLEFTANVVKSKRELSFNYGPNNSYRLELNYKPLKLTIYKHGLAVIIVNERQFLNIEHYRTEEENPAHIIPALETSFGMFNDSFKDSTDDSLPFGPEAVAIDISLVGIEHVYGLPEHADSLCLKSTVDTDWPYRLYNVDIFEYETNSRMPMYGSIPLLVGVKPQTSVGVFWMNSADTFVDIDKQKSISTHWMSENGVLDMVLIVGDSPDEITSKYGLLTGNINLPQKFALGYHQCRWNYVSQNDVLDVHAKMDEYGIPYDTIWLDVEYADQKKYFTWDTAQFPNPVSMMKQLEDTGRNLVVIVDPHLKTSYEVSDYVDQHHLAMLDSFSETYKGHCWPGESIWIDSLNPGSQEYWDCLFQNQSKVFIGTQENVHVWNDMNEPSVFNGPETTAPKNNVHYGDVEHRSVHNIWGKSFHELTYNSLVKRLQNSVRQRPFILTRSFYAGSQRTAATWTGDNMAKWEYLKISIPMVLTANVANMPFSGADVGGFFGDPPAELLSRWYQTGIWYPFFRAHAHIDSRRREPYLAEEPYMSIMRDAIRLRYALLPTMYTLFHESSINGAPIWRPMVYDNLEDVHSYEIDDQFFLGSSGLLVKPVTDEAVSAVSVYIPKDGQVYYDYTNGKFSEDENIYVESGIITKEVSLNDIPVFLKGGSIIVRQDRYRRSSRLMERDPYTLVIGLSRTGTASGFLYMDDGESFAYRDGAYAVVQFKMANGTLTSTISDNSYAQSLAGIKVEKIIIAGIATRIKSVATLSVREQKEEDRKSRFSQRNQVVIIKNPAVHIAANWTINLMNDSQP